MTTQYLLFNAEISATTTPQLTQAIVDAIDDSRSLTSVLGYDGRKRGDGVALYHLLRSSPKPVTMHGIGNVIYGYFRSLGRDERYAVQGTRFIFHSVGTVINGRVGIPALN